MASKKKNATTEESVPKEKAKQSLSSMEVTSSSTTSASTSTTATFTPISSLPPPPDPELSQFSFLSRSPRPPPPAPAPPSDIDRVLSYCDQLKATLSPEDYNTFIAIMIDFRKNKLDSPTVITKVKKLLQGHPELFEGFKEYTPPSGDHLALNGHLGPGNAQEPIPNQLSDEQHRALLVEFNNQLREQLTAEQFTLYLSLLQDYKRQKLALEHLAATGQLLFSTVPNLLARFNWFIENGISLVLDSKAKQQQQKQQSAAAAPPPTPQQLSTAPPSTAEVPESREPTLTTTTTNQSVDAFIESVRQKLSPSQSRAFLSLMKDYNGQKSTIPQMTKRGRALLKGHPDLLESFNWFLINSLSTAIETVAKSVVITPDCLQALVQEVVAENVVPEHVTEEEEAAPVEAAVAISTLMTASDSLPVAESTPAPAQPPASSRIMNPLPSPMDIKLLVEKVTKSAALSASLELPKSDLTADPKSMATVTPPSTSATATTPPVQQQKFEKIHDFIDAIRAVLTSNQFLKLISVLVDFKSHDLTVAQRAEVGRALLAEHPHFIEAFETFLARDYSVDVGSGGADECSAFMVTPGSNTHVSVRLRSLKVPKGDSASASASASSESKKSAATAVQENPEPEEASVNTEPAPAPPKPTDFNLELSVHMCAYLDQIQDQLDEGTMVKLVDILRYYHHQQMDIPTLIAQVKFLFKETPQHFEGFKSLLPAGYERFIEENAESGSGKIEKSEEGPEGRPETQNAPPPPPAPHQRLLPSNPELPGKRFNITEALDYFTQVQETLGDRKYKAFLEMLQDFRIMKIGLLQLVETAKKLFKYNPELMEGFNAYLVPGLEMTLTLMSGGEETTPTSSSATASSASAAKVPDVVLSNMPTASTASTVVSTTPKPRKVEPTKAAKAKAESSRHARSRSFLKNEDKQSISAAATSSTKQSQPQPPPPTIRSSQPLISPELALHNADQQFFATLKRHFGPRSPVYNQILVLLHNTENLPGAVVTRTIIKLLSHDATLLAAFKSYVDRHWANRGERRLKPVLPYILAFAKKIMIAYKGNRNEARLVRDDFYAIAFHCLNTINEWNYHGVTAEEAEEYEIDAILEIVDLFDGREDLTEACVATVIKPIMQRYIGCLPEEGSGSGTESSSGQSAVPIPEPAITVGVCTCSCGKSNVSFDSYNGSNHHKSNKSGGARRRRMASRK